MQWVVFAERVPVKLVADSRRWTAGFDVIEDRAVVLATRTKPPQAAR